ncbi:hypothetical protein J41TS2_07810 [Bacillus sonorensis]|nr:hypothetical protein J41TS2_07810 [Bacillus sonorensis]
MPLKAANLKRRRPVRRQRTNLCLKQIAVRSVTPIEQRSRMADRLCQLYPNILQPTRSECFTKAWGYIWALASFSLIRSERRAFAS